MIYDVSQILEVAKRAQPIKAWLKKLPDTYNPTPIHG
jgi:hypothetical protein